MTKVTVFDGLVFKSNNVVKMDIVYQKLVELLPPVAILGILAYVTRFLGRIILDFKPIPGNQEESPEMVGIIFFSGVIIFYGILGVLAGLHFGSLGMGHVARFIITIVCVGWLWLIWALLTEKTYGVRLPILHFSPYGADEERKFAKRCLGVSRFIPLFLFSIVFAYILTIECQIGNFGWIILMSVEILTGVIFMAAIYGMSSIRLPQVDIFFDDNRDPILKAVLFKINRDDVRVKIVNDGKDQAVLINRDKIKRIDFFPPVS